MPEETAVQHPLPNRGNTRNAFERYRYLDTWFQGDRIYSIEQLLYKFKSINIVVSRRTLYNDLKYMMSLEGYNAPIIKEREIGGHTMYYKYADPNFSILNKPLTHAEEVALKETIKLLGVIGNMHGFTAIESVATNLQSNLDIKQDKNVIVDFQENQYLKGIDFLNPLYRHITNQLVLKITYKSFKSEECSTYTISPYYLKQFNNRWFLFGWNHTDEYVQNLALDRIEQLHIVSKVLYRENDTDFEEYFEDIIGVTNRLDASCEQVQLKFSDRRLPYVLTKPLHGSQKLTDGIIILDVKINPELVSLLLSYGADVQVLGPASLVEQMKEETLKMVEAYKSVLLE